MPIQKEWLLLNFAHDTTVVLSGYVQQFNTICWSRNELQQNKPFNANYKLKIVGETGPRTAVNRFEILGMRHVLHIVSHLPEINGPVLMKYVDT